MIRVKADLHIHTVASPCSSLTMSPRRIIGEAVKKNLQVIGITDHNCTLQCGIVEKLASEKGMLVLKGAEINTREEIHCLVFFRDHDKLAAFQEYIMKYLPGIPNRPDKFGYQVLVDEDDNILRFIDELLISGIDRSIEQVQHEVAGLGGIFIPAHIDRAANGILNQLGFIPPDLEFEALEISGRTDEISIRKNLGLPDVALVKSSDAHFPEQIGSSVTLFDLEELSFDGMVSAFREFKRNRIFIE